MLRTMLERVTRRSVFRRRLPPEHGGAPMYVSASAGLKYLFRPMDRIDPTLVSLAKEFVQRGSVVWDVGANVGLFTFSAAHHAGAEGRVIAFEPDAWLVQLLRRSVSIQPPASAPVEVLPVAVARACEDRAFNLSARSRATNSLSGYGATDSGIVREQLTVSAVSLDSIRDGRLLPDVIKIDVEGAELEVLTGAAQLLQEKRPVILCEVSSRNTAEVTALLKERGYRLYNADDPSSSRTERAAASWSTLAIG